MLEWLELHQFRCYDAFTMEPDPSINLIIGGNAQGKTSILEGIHTLSLGRSYKTQTDGPLIKQGSDFARLHGRVRRGGRPQSFELVLSHAGKKASVNGVEQARLSDYAGRLRTVVFAPEDLSVVKGGPAERRGFLDVEISQLDRLYVGHLSRYRKLLKERNERLKQLKPSDTEDALLDVLGEQLAHYGRKLIRARAAFVERLSAKLRDIHPALSEEDDFRIAYQPSVDEGGHSRLLRERRAYDLLRGSTSTGPHRDDLGFYYGEHPVREIASQGQIRTIALALKLAVVDLLAEERDPPLVLLDDVFSELDRERQKKLLGRLEGGTQIFITATDLSGIHLDALGSYRVFEVEAATIKGVTNYG